MHEANKRWWIACRNKYPDFFSDPTRVLECGSYDINGSLRDFFACRNYTGVDWRDNPSGEYRGVDIVSIVHQLSLPNASYDVVASSSMLEHDPFWEQSLMKMIDLLSPNGVLFLSWGAARCPTHCIHEAPDGHYHPLPVQRVLGLLKQKNIYVHDCRYECHLNDTLGPITGRYAPKGSSMFALNRTGEGEVVLIGFKNKNLAHGECILDTWFPEDEDIE